MSAHPKPPVAVVDPARPPRDTRPWWRRIVPFAIALLLTTALLVRLDLAVFVAHLRAVNYLAFLAFCGVFMISLLGADSFATAFVYSRTLCPIKAREVFLIRGASYLPSMVNHHIGQAWLTWYMARAYDAPLWRAAGATLLVYATTFASLFMFGAAALVFDGNAPWWLAPVLALGAVGGVTYLIIIKVAPPFLAQRQLLAPLFEVGVRGHLAALAMRLPHVGVLFLGSWLPFRFFDVDIPPAAAFAYVPVLMVVAALPVTPQGFGTRDWFSLHYFARFANGETLAEREAAVAATTITFAIAISIFQAIIALVLMHRALLVLERARQRPPP